MTIRPNRRQPAARPVAAALLFLALSPAAQTPCAAASFLAARSAMAAADAPAAASGSDLPIRRITLYRSGVAAIERDARIDGPKTFQLRFRAEEIDDLLRSMVLLDMGGGQPGTVAYASRDPLERRLGSLRINLTDNPSIPEILGQLRGARVRLELTGSVVTGTVLGTEVRTIPASGERGGTMPQPFVNMLTDDGIRSISVADLRSFRIMDADLAGDLDRALAAAYEDRAEQIRTVDVSFRGEPGRTRDVLASYIQEAPVWKTSYRLVLDEPDKEGSAAILQAWAIVENATDEDWRGVTLSLASGRPVAFTMRLADPIYAFRPELPVPAAEGIRPRDFATGRPGIRPSPPPRPPSVPSAMMRMAPAEAAMDAAEMESASDRRRMADALADAGGDATGADVGGQFLFTVDAPITLDRRRSAMIPLATRSVPTERLSIFDPRSGRTNPMRGAEMTNESGLDLLPGPIAVYDGDRYAGDATILHTARGQKRLLAYALDTDTEVQSQMRHGRDVLRIAADSGELRIRMRDHWTHTYELSTSDTGEGRTVLVEHPRMHGAELVGAAPRETTQDSYRFSVSLEPGGSESLTVREERVTIQQRRIGSLSAQAMIDVIGTGPMDRRLTEALRTASAMQADIAQAETQIAAWEKRITEIAGDQSRLRSNIASVPNGSDLHGRYLRTLNDQENELEELRTQMTHERTRLNTRRQELDQFLRNLTID